MRRVVAVGVVAELPIEWHYFLVNDGQGQQVVFAFTAESSLVPKLSECDQSIVDSVEFLGEASRAAALPATTR